MFDEQTWLSRFYFRAAWPARFMVVGICSGQGRRENRYLTAADSTNLPFKVNLDDMLKIKWVTNNVSLLPSFDVSSIFNQFIKLKSVTHAPKLKYAYKANNKTKNNKTN